MSILIKGMEMPETCKLCYLSEFDPGFYAYVCKPIGMRIDYDMAIIDRPRTICPLVPIPPHGDLIDRDQFIDFIKTHWDSYDKWFIDQLEARPTIIQTRKEGET